MVSKSEIQAGGAAVYLTTNLTALQRGLASGATMLTAWGNKVKRLGMTAFSSSGALPGPLGEVLDMVKSPAGALGGLALAAQSFAESGDAIAQMSDRTGVAVEALSQLKFAAKMFHIEMDTVELGLKKMSVYLVEAAGGGKEHLAMLRGMGVNLRELNKAKPDEAFSMMAEGIARIPNPMVQAAVAVKIFGRNGTMLLPLLNQGRAGIKDLRDAAEELGFTMSRDTAEQADKLAVKLSFLSWSVKSTVNAIGQGVAPMMMQFSEGMMATLKGVRNWIKANPTLFEQTAKWLSLVVGAGAVLTAFGSALNGIGSGLGMLGSLLSTVAPMLVAVISGVWGMITSFSVFGIPIGVIAVIGAALAAGIGGIVQGGLWKAMGNVWDNVTGWFKKRGDKLWDIVSMTWGGIWTALGRGDVAGAGNVAWAGLKALGSVLAESLRQAINGLVGGLIDAAAGFAKAMIAGIKWAIESAVEIIQTLAVVLRESLISAWHGVYDVMRAGMAKLPGWMGGGPYEVPTAQRDVDKADRAARDPAALREAQGIATGWLGTGWIDTLAAGAKAWMLMPEPGRDKQGKPDKDGATWETRTMVGLMDAIAGIRAAPLDKHRRQFPNGEGILESLPGQKTANLSTFNPWAMGQMGGGGVAERTAVATENTARETAAMRREIGGFNRAIIAFDRMAAPEFKNLDWG